MIFLRCLFLTFRRNMLQCGIFYGKIGKNLSKEESIWQKIAVVFAHGSVLWPSSCSLPLPCLPSTCSAPVSAGWQLKSSAVFCASFYVVLACGIYILPRKCSSPAVFGWPMVLPVLCCAPSFLSSAIFPDLKRQPLPTGRGSLFYLTCNWIEIII